MLDPYSYRQYRLCRPIECLYMYFPCWWLFWVNIAAHCLICFTFSLNLYTSNPWRSDNPYIVIPANPEPENGCKAYCVIRTVGWLVLFIMTVEGVGASACGKKKERKKAQGSNSHSGIIGEDAAWALFSKISSDFIIICLLC